MRLIIQRVKRATLKVHDRVFSEIDEGLLVLVGITHEDQEEDLDWLASKLTNMRLFSDENDKINLCVSDLDYELLLVSQFTLFASTKKGNRPSFMDAARPENARVLFELFTQKVTNRMPNKVKTGCFGEDMQIDTQLDGPVSIQIDSKQRN
ncbi:MAG: D-aminoacyl-tRNA deacylase [Bacteroidia bacterium]